MNKALKRRKLGQIAEFRNGLNFGKASHGQGCLLIGIPDFADRFTPDLKSLGTINPQGISRDEDYLKKGDIVFVRSNGNKALVGRSLYIDKDIEALYSGFCIRARFVSDEIDPKFCAYYTRTQTFRNQISGSAGTNINNLNQGILADVEVPVFSRETQQKIVSVLEALDAKIELNNQINAELEAMAKLLYDYWFVQFDFPMTAAQAASLGRPDLEGKPYKSSGGKMVHNPTLNRQIPEGWNVKNLGDLCSTTRGVTYGKTDVRTPDESGTVPILRATNVSNGILDLNDLVYVSEEMAASDQLMNRFDILIVMSSGSKAHVGKNALYYFDFKTAYGAFCSKITAHVKNRFFVAVHLQSEGFKKHIANVCLGTSINNLTNSHITDHQVIVPGDTELERFESTVRSYFEQIACHHNQNRELTQLRDWLLPMLMNGQVTVGA